MTTAQRQRPITRRFVGFAAAGLLPYPAPVQALEWQPLPPQPARALQWRMVHQHETIARPTFQLPPPPPLPPLDNPATQVVVNQSQPIPADFLRPITLGPAVPTANLLPADDLQLSAYVLSPFGGGAAGGTGNQNYALRLDASLSERLLISGFYSYSDDPLYAPLIGFGVQPGNFWESYGGGFTWRIASDASAMFPGSAGERWNLAITGSLEGWNVGSGGCDSFGCQGNVNASPNIFNDSGQRVFTKNVVGSVALPFSWDASEQWQFTLTPGASFLPTTQGEGQGGAGTFYGTNIWLAGGALWRAWPGLQLFGSALMPFGPGTNSFDANLAFSREPILTGGLQWSLNPRIALTGMLTNGFGATPATALLALPSSNQLSYSAKFTYTAGGVDTPQPDLTARQWSLASGGLTVNTALVPPSGTTQLWANADNKGNIFGYLGYSLSNIFQLDLFNAGAFEAVQPVNDYVANFTNTYATSGGWNWRVGGKAVAFSPLRGAPFWGAGRISLGRNNDPTSFQGYVFAETMGTWEANQWLALTFSPKAAWSGIGTPWGVGLSANVQLGSSFQLIPELNLIGSDLDASNGTVALRWLAARSGDKTSTNVDIYVSNASGLLDIGQMLRTSDTRIGSRLSITF